MGKLQFQRLFRGMKKLRDDFKKAKYERQVMDLDDDNSQIGSGKMAAVLEKIKGETVFRLCASYKTKNGNSPR